MHGQVSSHYPYFLSSLLLCPYFIVIVASLCAASCDKCYTCVTNRVIVGGDINRIDLRDVNYHVTIVGETRLDITRSGLSIDDQVK
jgi:thiamine monophosphate kinase